MLVLCRIQAFRCLHVRAGAHKDVVRGVRWLGPSARVVSFSSEKARLLISALNLDQCPDVYNTHCTWLCTFRVRHLPSS